jgi:hypothetical protein
MPYGLRGVVGACGVGRMPGRGDVCTPGTLGTGAGTLLGNVAGGAAFCCCSARCICIICCGLA